MTWKINNNSTLLLLTSVPTFFITAVFAITDLYDFYTVAIKKETIGLPFGVEGFEHLKNVDVYAKHTLTTGLVATLLFLLTLFFFKRRQTLGPLVILVILISYIAFNVWKTI